MRLGLDGVVAAVLLPDPAVEVLHHAELLLGPPLLDLLALLLVVSLLV